MCPAKDQKPPAPLPTQRWIMQPSCIKFAFVLGLLCCVATAVHAQNGPVESACCKSCFAPGGMPVFANCTNLIGANANANDCVAVPFPPCTGGTFFGSSFVKGSPCQSINCGFCGDGTLDLGNSEECDDGNNVDGDGCGALCRLENQCCVLCANANSYSCFSRDDISSSGDCAEIANVNCSNVMGFLPTAQFTRNSTCEQVCRCGDGTVDPEEECDDGNAAVGDGCSQFCTLEDQCCILCVDTNFSSCVSDDDMNEADCTGSVSNSFCSNFGGVLDAKFTLDSTCEQVCRCGNGVVDPEEECDDGNRVSGDGCDADCTTSPLPPSALPGYIIGGILLLVCCILSFLAFV